MLRICTFLSPAGVADTGRSAVLSGLMNQSSASSHDKGLWKVCVCGTCALPPPADVSSWCECVLCATQMLGLLGRRGDDGRMVVFVLPGG